MDGGAEWHRSLEDDGPERPEWLVDGDALLLQRGRRHQDGLAQGPEVWTRIRGWVDNGYLPREAAQWDQQVAWTQFMTGQYAFGVNGNWQIGNAKQAATFPYGVVQFPSGSAGSQVFLGGEGTSIGAFTKQSDLAWEFMKETFLSKEGQLILLREVGSIPTRTDAAADQIIAGAPLLSVFAKGIPTGRKLPLTDEENKAYPMMGDAFSAVVSGAEQPAAPRHACARKIGALLK